jgi:uncharacterized protein YjiK
MKATLPAVLLLQSLSAAGCSDVPASGAAADSTSAGPPTPTAAPPPYDVAQPDTVLTLAPALLEISGLGVLPDGRLAAVFDEDGVLFALDPESGATLEEQRFGGNGDYEGVEWAEGATWILQSNGTLHSVADDGGEVTEFDTWLRASCDAEGLGFDGIGRDLLIVCKENPGQQLTNVRAVYAFDLESHTLAETPALVVDTRVVDAREQFKPSAIAVHPGTRQVYILSSVRNAVAILDATGDLLSVTPLPESLYAQPEGLAFARDGTLFISNEGVDGPATLLRFTPRP